MFWCCTGSGMENFTKLGDSIYFRANDTLLVNQYVASKVTWEEKNLVLTQKSDVTKSEEISFVLNALQRNIGCGDCTSDPGLDAWGSHDLCKWRGENDSSR